MTTTAETMDPEGTILGEDGMISEARWAEIQRRTTAAETVSAIARALDLDRKAVRAARRTAAWQPCQRAPQATQMLTAHETFLRARVGAVEYSAQGLLWYVHRK